jgi:hypothetical protein
LLKFRPALNPSKFFACAKVVRGIRAKVAADATTRVRCFKNLLGVHGCG